MFCLFVSFSFLNVGGLVSVLGKQEGFFVCFLHGQQTTLHLAATTNVSVNHALFFGFTKLPLLPLCLASIKFTELELAMYS